MWEIRFLVYVNVPVIISAILVLLFFPEAVTSNLKLLLYYMNLTQI